MQVRNRRTLDTLYHTLYADEIKMMEEAEQEDELYHHGVEGMSWGDRNGPPYPLGGVDKKVARAEYKAKKEKERRLKKLQRAAKKARKVKAKNAKQEAEILKKKQKLVKEGDLDKIRKNANLFTNEELQYVIERDNQKRALGSKDERTADEKFELAMKRMAQIGDIAANAGKVLSAAKTGADLLTSFKSAKVKDLEAEDKRLSAIKTEFEMRFKGREDSPEAQRFVNYAVNNEQYEPSKAEKKVAKQLDKEREAVVKDSKRALKEADERYKEAKKAEKQAEKEADPKYQKKMAEKERKQALKEAVENADRDRKIAKQEYEKQVKFQQQMDKIAQKDTDKRVKDFAKGLDADDAWRSIKADNAAKQELKRQFGSVAEETFGKPYTTIGDSSYTHYGSDWATSFLSSGKTKDAIKTREVIKMPNGSLGYITDSKDGIITFYEGKPIWNPIPGVDELDRWPWKPKKKK